MTAKRFIHTNQFNSDWVKFAGQSAAGDVTVVLSAQDEDIDYDLDFDACLTGAMLIVKGGKVSDKVSLRIMSGQTLLDEFVTDWYVAEDTDLQFIIDLKYPANLPSGVTIRAYYQAANVAGTRNIRLNYFLHKVLVTE